LREPLTTIGAITDLKPAQRRCPICGEVSVVTRWRPAFLVGPKPYRARYKLTCSLGHTRREDGPDVDVTDSRLAVGETDWQNGLG
jgi:hypothetical protein